MALVDSIKEKLGRSVYYIYYHVHILKYTSSHLLQLTLKNVNNYLNTQFIYHAFNFEDLKQNSFTN